MNIVKRRGYWSVSVGPVCLTYYGSCGGWLRASAAAGGNYGWLLASVELCGRTLELAVRA